MNKIIQRSFLNALGTVAYVSILTTVMMHGEKLFSHINEAIAPVAFLTLFVLSAAVTGGLVLGKPLMLFLNNEKSDAVRMFIYTLCWLALAVAVLLIASIQFK